MPVDKFLIALEDPFMIYFPGQEVKGKVVFGSHKQRKTQGLSLAFTGKASVYWTEDRTETSGTGDDRTETTVTDTYHDSDQFFTFTKFLVGDGHTDVFLPSGESSYVFSFLIPTSQPLPASFHGRYGQVEYVLEATVHRSWRSNYRARQPIMVKATVDLNFTPMLRQPAEERTSKKFCCLCCASGPLTINTRLQRRGFVPGEIMVVETEANNLSNRIVKTLSAALVQESKYIAGFRSNTSSEIMSATHSGKSVAPKDCDVWVGELRIPPLPPTNLGGCRIIKVGYSLVVTAEVTGLAFSLRLAIPVTIGTIRLRTADEEDWPPASTTMPLPTFARVGDVEPDCPPPYEDLRFEN